MELTSELLARRAVRTSLGQAPGTQWGWGLLPGWVPSHSLFFPQLRVHAEFLSVVFPAAGLGGVCVCDLRLREGESPSHATQRASYQWQRPLLRPEHHTWPGWWAHAYTVLAHNWH